MLAVGKGGVAPLIFNLGSRCSCVVRLTPRPLYPRRKSPFAIEYGDKIKEGGQCWRVACMGEKRDAYMAKATIAEGKRPLGIPKRRSKYGINPLNAELSPICHLLALLGAHHILHVSRIRVNVDLRKTGWETSA